MYEITNITQSRANVPFNSSEKEPKYVLEPGDTVLLPEEYLKGLDGDAQQRFIRVTSGTAPMFAVRNVGDTVAKLQAQSKGKGGRPKPPPAPEHIPQPAPEAPDGSDELPSNLP